MTVDTQLPPSKPETRDPKPRTRIVIPGCGCNLASFVEAADVFMSIKQIMRFTAFSNDATVSLSDVSAKCMPETCDAACLEPEIRILKRETRNAKCGLVRGVSRDGLAFISQEVFIKSFGKSQFPHKFGNLSFIIINTKNKLTDLCGNQLLQNDFIDTFCEIKTLAVQVFSYDTPMLTRMTPTAANSAVPPDPKPSTQTGQTKDTGSKRPLT